MGNCPDQQLDRGGADKDVGRGEGGWAAWPPTKAPVAAKENSGGGGAMPSAYSAALVTAQA